MFDDSILLSADCVASSPGAHPGEAGREQPRAVGGDPHRAGLDLRSGQWSAMLTSNDYACCGRLIQNDSMGMLLR